MTGNLNKNDKVERMLSELWSPIHPDILLMFELINGNEEALYHFMKNYWFFNNRFAAGVCALTANIHNSLGFDGHNERGSLIAANVYKACDHEYHELINGKEYTHAQLSKYFLRNLDALVFPQPFHRSGSFAPSDEIKKISYKVMDAYQAYMSKEEIESVDYKRLAKGLGFHMASEFIAAAEYHTITTFSAFQFITLYNKMQKPTNETGFENISPWHWVSIHATVEIEHFAASLKSYRDSEGLFDKNHVLDGIRLFQEISKEFMDITEKEIKQITTKN